jgi:hypothetical protein
MLRNLIVLPSAFRGGNYYHAFTNSVRNSSLGLYRHAAPYILHPVHYRDNNINTCIPIYSPLDMGLKICPIPSHIRSPPSFSTQRFPYRLPTVLFERRFPYCKPSFTSINVCGCSSHYSISYRQLRPLIFYSPFPTDLTLSITSIWFFAKRSPVPQINFGGDAITRRVGPLRVRLLDRWICASPPSYPSQFTIQE